MTADQARAFVAAILSSLTRHMRDRAILAVVGADFQRLMAGRVGAEECEGVITR